MTTQYIHTYPKFQAFDANGDPLNGGKLYTYANGTSTPKTTYADKDGATPNANPVVLDSRGEAVIYGSGYYKFVLKDSADTTIWTIDDLIMGNVGSDFVSLTDDYENDLVAAIVDISTTQTTLLISQAYTLNADLTIPSNVTLWILRNAIITIASTKTLTIAGDILAGAYQIFTVTGTLTYTGNIMTHDKWADGSGDDLVPSVDVTIDIGEAAKRIKTAYIRDVNLQNINLAGLFIRPRFARKDADEIYCYGYGWYHVTDKIAYISGTLTLQKASGGTDIHYLYIDYSEIPANGILAADDLYFATAEPVANATKGGWYHATATDDRCIFAIKTVSDTIQDFSHYGNLVHYEAQNALATNANYGTPTEVDASAWVPVFSRDILATIDLDLAGAVTAFTALWRGSAAGSDHIWARAYQESTGVGQTETAGQARIEMAAASFWVTTQVDTDCDADIYIDGYFLGMNQI